MRLLGLLFFLIYLPAAAQTFPVDAVSGKIYYAEEVLVKDGPLMDLYHRGKNWFAACQTNKTITVDDVANGILMGSAYSSFSVRQAGKNQSYQLYYTLKLQMEDDRYWYSFTDFEIQLMAGIPALAKIPANKQSLEKLVLLPKAAKLNKEEKLEQQSFEKTVYSTIAPLIKDLKKSMNQ